MNKETGELKEPLKNKKERDHVKKLKNYFLFKKGA